ncbi:hypothetical protein LSUB1_G007711 [Lachnellula subtilissima]|uniref:J domain-containing protein n=1 Tax=Lachnellula subtilissima TaxID=602034 RepID=A0A8H8RGL5_9HELO|nr:hypothetical protein LSUB1_G007711 [Lachnellula subtilissima]
MSSGNEGDAVANASDPPRDNDEYRASHKSKFRFKSKRKSSHDEESRGSSRHRDEERHHRHHKHHHRSKRRKPSPAKDDPSLYDDTHLPNTSSAQFADPDVAFRESLFDAMADDEGASFWEGVYGQPIHTYPDVKEGPTGELEQMTDEEYTAYVRGKMYEKTHQHLVEEKRRRDEAKKEREKAAKEGRREEREAQRFRSKVEEMESGKRKDVCFKEIERFFLYAPSSGEPTEMQLGKVLKTERVRWHPDKIQQKLGGQDVAEDVLQAVTEVFQLIDRMWSEIRDQKK